MAKVYRTAQGRSLDMETIRLQNELVPALGDMKVNARGDQLGPGGKIIKTREMIMDEYYQSKASPTENIPTAGPIPTRNNARRKSDPLPTSSKRATEFSPGAATPDDVFNETSKAGKAAVVETSPESETKLKGGLAAALAKAQKSEKKVKRIE